MNCNKLITTVPTYQTDLKIFKILFRMYKKKYCDYKKITDMFG